MGKQEAGSRKQEAGSRKQEAGSRKEKYGVSSNIATFSFRIAQE